MDKKQKLKEAYNYHRDRLLDLEEQVEKHRDKLITIRRIYEDNYSPPTPRRRRRI